MPSSANASSSISRKFVWLAGAIVAGVLLWTTGWYFFATKIEDHLPATLTELAGPGASAECTNAEVRGYPFRVGLFCDNLSYTNSVEGISAAAGAFRSAAQVYSPQHAVAEIDGPLVVDATGLVLRADWQLMQASIQAVSDGLDRGSIDARTASINIDGAGLTQRLSLQADRITAHARRNGTDLDIAAYGENLKNGLIAGLSTKAFAFEATLSGQSGLLQMPFTPLHGPFDAVLHRVAIEFDEASSLELAGPVQVSADGQISGNLELTISNLQQFSRLASDFNPDIAGLLSRFGPMIAALDTKPGDDATTLPLTIRNNQVSLGFIPLGKLPSF
ncbi:DUF2125 domain-containing protein [Hoeflea sp. AS60]|uniref:DUF2125 domain-containing protein n=1 Tax=Hoeflea sp. AS60 TaxID=3135780 RepID=UPI003173EB15